MTERKLLPLIYLFICATLETTSTGGSGGRNLANHLMLNYQRSVRPAKGFNESVRVRFKLFLNELIDVDEVSQKIVTKTWLYHRWTDLRLQWDPQDYDGIRHIRLPAEKLWLPIFALYNNSHGAARRRIDGEGIPTSETFEKNLLRLFLSLDASMAAKSFILNCMLTDACSSPTAEDCSSPTAKDGALQSGCLTYVDGDFAVPDARLAKIFYNGTIEWIPPTAYSSFCEIQVANFPFDTQNCTMKIGPWTRGENLLDMVNLDGRVINHTCEKPDIENYNENGEWKLLSTGCYKHYLQYLCCKGPYVDMTYHFVIQRRPMYHIMNILFPTILFAVLTSAVFYLPSEGAEKMTLSISLLLTLVLFLLVIVDTIPSTANGVPLLGTYILFTMILVTLSIIITVIELNIHYRSPATHLMPNWIREVFIGILPRRMLQTTVRIIDTKQNVKSKNRNLDIGDVSGRKEGKESSLALNPDFRKAMDEVAMMVKRYEWEEKKYWGETEWKYVAMVMDRFLLQIFFVSCVLGTILIFAKRLIEMSYEEEMFKNNDGKCLLNCKAVNGDL